MVREKVACGERIFVNDERQVRAGQTVTGPC
jgi:hypothetical protein